MTAPSPRPTSTAKTVHPSTVSRITAQRGTRQYSASAATVVRAARGDHHRAPRSLPRERQKLTPRERRAGGYAPNGVTVSEGEQLGDERAVFGATPAAHAPRAGPGPDPAGLLIGRARPGPDWHRPGRHGPRRSRTGPRS